MSESLIVRVYARLLVIHERRVPVERRGLDWVVAGTPPPLVYQASHRVRITKITVSLPKGERGHPVTLPIREPRLPLTLERDDTITVEWPRPLIRGHV